MDSIEIVGYADEYARAFDALNRAWLEHYELFEESDRKHLEHPRTSILATGGEIFFALANGEVVGTCAAIVCDAETIELAKLAVREDVRGLGIGRALTEAALAWARERRARRVILVSSTKLRAALQLYERLGFRHGPVPADAAYVTADVYMELVLDRRERED